MSSSLERRAAKPPSWALRPDYAYLGLGAAACVMASWGGVLLYALHHGLGGGVLRAVFLMALMTWLYTALFIVAHDAMHALVAPRHRRLNHAVGELAAALYAQFAYEPLRAAHAEHHRAPASLQDPDWHDGTHDSAAAWFATFMLRYVTVAQLARLGVAGAALHLGFGFDVPSLALFWAMPSVLSAVQLFVFGTYLPHRSVAGDPHVDAHRARSLLCSDAASLLSCLNFGGCHHEHHAFPAVPWWRLHRLRAALRAGEVTR